MPEKYPLKYAPAYPDVIAKLEATLRTGWVRWGIPNPENVWEHILDIRKLAISYQESLGLSDQDLEDVLAIIEIHDWPEALVGDLVIMGDETNVIELRKNKKQLEKEAMLKICQDTQTGDEVLALYERYENATDANALIAKQLDKLQAIHKAAAYEELYHKPGLLAEFVNYSKDYFTHPFILAEYHRLASRI